MSLAEQEVYENVLAVLTKDTEGNYERLLHEIVQWELQNPPQNEEYAQYWGFEWFHVHGDARVLNSLVTRGILNVVFKSNKSTTYRTIDREAMRRALKDYVGALVEEKEEEAIPEDLLEIVVGHESKKEIIKRSLSASKPVPILLWGSVASAKTLTLEELSRLPNSKLVLGSSLTKAGLYEILFDERPKYLLLDELDKIDGPENLAALLSLMERGLVTEAKFRRHRTIRLKTWVFASANDVSKIPRELMSRFLKLRFQDYTPEEFTDVVANVLRDREGISESLALFISERVMRDLDSRDVRDAVKVARLLKNRDKQEVEHIVEILKKQK